MNLHRIITSRHCRRTAIMTVTAMIALILLSCSDTLESMYGPEGEKTVITLKIKTPEMIVRTRGDIDKTQAFQVDNVWIGIYDAKSGKLKTKLTVNKNQTPDGHLPEMLVESIETTSGMSHIAAVANTDKSFGVRTDKYETHLRPLSELLDESDTWEKFRAISVAQTQTGNVNTPIGSLPMSGMYYDKKTEDAGNWIEAVSTPFYIPAGKNITLPGAVHLRRLMSQVRFNIIAGDNIEISPISWQVDNTPDVSYLCEQKTNAADDIENRDGEKLYTNSGLFHGFEKSKTTLGNGTTKDCTTFDFWMFDNKHDGLDKTGTGTEDYYGADTYSDREREWKTDDAGSDKKTNTGIYKSLCPTAEGNTNNNATRVKIKARVTYNVITTQNADGTETERVVPEGTAGSVQRIGYSTYTVHLGYCDGADESAKSKDFNCRRNTRYTYNMTVEGLNKIKVEATTDGEPQPGTDGDITDIRSGRVSELDAHYNVFNITLTNRQRQYLKWLIRSPFGDGGAEYSLFSEDYKPGGIHEGEDISDNQFYTWIHFKPTTDSETLRVYNDGGGNNDLMTLQDLTDINGHPGVRRNGNNYNAYTNIDDTPLHYTVFVDEYVYTKNANGQPLPIDGWRNFVNKEPRIVWLVIDELNMSADKESMYITSDYMIMQNSIMTYYNDLSPTAIGIEHVNETFGFNLGWSQTAAGTRLPDNNMSADNGRYNTWQYLKYQGNNQRPITWSDISPVTRVRINGKTVNTLKACHRAAINTVQYPLTAQGEEIEPEDGVTSPVFQISSFNANNRWPDRKKLDYNPKPGSNQPLYEIITACMNRNRDENGDGVIDASELKWYVPTSGKYARIILGRNSIKEPLMDFALTPYYDGKNDASDNNTRFHFASSDKMIIWAEEGTSSSLWSIYDWDTGAWQIRCIRNLGVDPGNIQANDPINMAYEADTEKRTFEMKYYNTEVLRAGITGNLGEHDVTSSMNQPSYKFEYAKEDCSATNTDKELFNEDTLKSTSIDDWIKYVKDNSVCGKYSQEADGSDRGTWRVPNQKELVMMRRTGIFTLENTHWMSCTREHYDMEKANGKKRFFASIKNNMTVNVEGQKNRHVRCVRDIIR